MIEIDRCVGIIADAKYHYYSTLKIYYMTRLQTRLNHFAEEHNVSRHDRPKCVALLVAAEI